MNMNTLDKQYIELLEDILENGVRKQNRTGVDTISVFGRQIRHDMSEGFPLLTTKKMAFKTMVTELLWFLRGDTSIEYLLKNDCNIWTGDAYKNYLNKRTTANKDNVREAKTLENGMTGQISRPFTQEEFINKIKTDEEFAKKWGELGPIYGKQWRSWDVPKILTIEKGKIKNGVGTEWGSWERNPIDQIANLINDLKTNPDSRRLMVSAWNVGEIDSMVLPPCHYGFQIYTRELSEKERMNTLVQNEQRLIYKEVQSFKNVRKKKIKDCLNERNVPTRAISLMWNQRSVDTPLGLPFNIASYGLLLLMIADEVNMVPEELIGNLGDTHIYVNQIDGIKEQIGRDYTKEERLKLLKEAMGEQVFEKVYNETMPFGGGMSEFFESYKIPKRTREPYPLPTVHIRDGIYCSSINDVILENYQSHPKIEFPLSN